MNRMSDDFGKWKPLNDAFASLQYGLTITTRSATDAQIKKVALDCFEYSLTSQRYMMIEGVDVSANAPALIKFGEIAKQVEERAIGADWASAVNLSVEALRAFPLADWAGAFSALPGRPTTLPWVDGPFSQAAGPKKGPGEPLEKPHGFPPSKVTPNLPGQPSSLPNPPGSIPEGPRPGPRPERPRPGPPGGNDEKES
jgi:hypothetical protein